MSIVQLPNNEPLPATFTCAICDKQIPPKQATAGFMAWDRTQTFACESHFWSGAQYILGWVDFINKQRVEAKKHGVELPLFGESSPYA